MTTLIQTSTSDWLLIRNQADLLGHLAQGISADQLDRVIADGDRALENGPELPPEIAAQAACELGRQLRYLRALREFRSEVTAIAEEAADAG